MIVVKKSLLTKAVVLIILLSVSFYAYLWINLRHDKTENSQLEKITLQVGSAKIVAEIADSPEELAKGLSGRDSLDADTGMYFILGSSRQATFHMRGMRFPLDIIWIDEDKVVGIEKNASIPSASIIPTFVSPQPVTHVLEVNSGFADRERIKIGDSVEIVR